MSRQDQANQDNVADRAAERFIMPRKAFIQPSKPLIVPTLNRDTTPAKPLAERSPLPTLNLPTLGRVAVKEPKARANGAASKQVTAPAQSGTQLRATMVKFGPEHVCSDEEFIIKTRAHTIHDPGMKELFFANGGEDMYEEYDTLAQAFDSLRRTKMMRLTGALSNLDLNTSYQRVPRLAGHDIKVYVPGNTVEESNRIREKARLDAKVRADNEAWVSSPLERRTA